MIWSMIYISAVLIANYTAVWFIPLPVFGLVAFGTLIFGITFTARDYSHKLGRKYVYTMIVIAAIMSGVLSLFGAVSWRIIIASVIAILISESVDTEIYQKLLKKSWLMRVTQSNSVSIPLDTILFNSVAFLGVFSLPALSQIVIGEIIVKFIVGFIVALWKFLN